ncbi:MAG: hypothetical protein ACRDPK_17225 [Carbonactinosporaceae bacterium]
MVTAGMGNDQVGMVTIGSVMLVLAWVCWTGRWRTWAENAVLRSIPVTVLPGTGLVCFLGGIATSLPQGPLSWSLFIPSALAGIAGVLLSFIDPSWWGPRWYRDYKRTVGEGERGDLSVLTTDKRRRGESSYDATLRHVHSDRPLPPGAWVYLVSGPAGRLASVRDERNLISYFPQAPVLSAGATPDRGPINEIIASETIVDVRREKGGRGLRSRFRIDTTEGPWVFDAFRAKRVVKELRRRYVQGRPAASQPGAAAPEARADSHVLDALDPFGEESTERGPRE